MKRRAFLKAMVGSVAATAMSLRLATGGLSIHGLLSIKEQFDYSVWRAPQIGDYDEWVIELRDNVTGNLLRKKAMISHCCRAVMGLKGGNIHAETMYQVRKATKEIFCDAALQRGYERQDENRAMAYQYLRETLGGGTC